MEDQLRLFLLLGGTVFILAVLAHGIWKIRKNNKPEERQRLEPRQWEDDNIDDMDDTESVDGFDELGIGSVRVVSNGAKPATSDDDNELADNAAPSEEVQQKNTEQVDDITSSNGFDGESADTEADDSKTQQEVTPKNEPKLYGAVVSNPKPHMAVRSGEGSVPDNVTEFPEPPGFLLKGQEVSGEPSSSSERSTSGSDVNGVSTSADNSGAQKHTTQGEEVERFCLDAQDEPMSNHSDEAVQHKRTSRIKRTRTSVKREEPRFGDDQMRIDFDTSQSGFESQGDIGFSALDEDEPGSSSADQDTVEQEVLVLNVRAQDDAVISGAALLPMLLTLGFKFGDQDIFHRHVNSNGKGPVLFSLANMFKPGVFDIDSLENFETQGVSLFMILPIEGDPHQVFNMMHNAARKLADEFGAQVLDGRRSVLTKQGLQQYVEKIREFERKRIISRS